MMELQDVLLKTRISNLHDVGLTGKGIRIAVLDSGVQKNHEFFQDAKIESVSLIDDEPEEDTFSHGTHVTSILLSVAPEATIINIKILDDKGNTKMSTIMKGVGLAKEMGADIINISVGDEDEDCPDDHPFDMLLKTLNEEGIIVIAAAGNSGPRTSPHFPASSRYAIAVGSMNSSFRTNRWSSKGPSCKTRKYPDCVAFGEDIFAANSDGDYKLLSGTSQSTPQVSGMLALVLQSIKRKLTKEETDGFLSKSCDWIEGEEKNNSSGWGAIDAVKFLRAVEVESLGIVEES